MPLYLGHITAQRLLERPGAENIIRSDYAHFEHCFAGKKDLDQIDLSPLGSLPRPLDVLVSSPNQARYWSGIVCHRCPEHLPAGAFIELSGDIYVASPELLFVLRASELSFAQTIDLGCWLCGSFTYGTNGTLIKRPPLTTPERLRSFVELCQRVKGIKNARNAIDWVIPGTASPMEAPCAIPFYLPKRLGGFGFPIPCLNYEIPLSQVGREIAGKECIRIDVFWKDFDFGFEYQGEESHGLYSALRSDIARQLAAEEHHIELQMMTIDQIGITSQRLAVARKTAKHLGINLEVSDRLVQKNQCVVDNLLKGCR